MNHNEKWKKAAALCVCITLFLCGCDSGDYKKATEFYESGNYAEAMTLFDSIRDYKDSREYFYKLYALAMDCIAEEEYKEAGDYFVILNSFKDTWDYRDDLYSRAEEYLADGEYDKAMECLFILDDYKDAPSLYIRAGAMRDPYGFLKEYLVQNGVCNKEWYAVAAEAFNDLGIYSVIYDENKDAVRFAFSDQGENITVQVEIPTNGKMATVYASVSTTQNAFATGKNYIMSEWSFRLADYTFNSRIEDVAEGQFNYEDELLLDMLGTRENYCTRVSEYIKFTLLYADYILRTENLGIVIYDLGFVNYDAPKSFEETLDKKDIYGLWEYVPTGGGYSNRILIDETGIYWRSWSEKWDEGRNTPPKKEEIKGNGNDYLSATGLSFSTFDPVTGVLVVKSTQKYDGDTCVFYAYRSNDTIMLRCEVLGDGLSELEEGKIYIPVPQ